MIRTLGLFGVPPPGAPMSEATAFRVTHGALPKNCPTRELKSGSEQVGIFMSLMERIEKLMTWLLGYTFLSVNVPKLRPT